MRLLITGGSGYLGQHLVPIAQPQVSALAYTYFSHDPLGWPQGHRLDVRDEQATLQLVADFRPDAIIHAAGSNEPAEMMDEVIRHGTEHIVAAARAVGARLVHLSTDVVFDGRDAPYREEDRPAPIHAYGRAKAAAEATVAAYSQHVIVRTSLIYSLTLMDRGTAWIATSLAAGKPVTLFVDQLRNPVWAPALSSACLELTQSAYCGILHVAGSQRLSRADYAVRLLEWWHIEDRTSLSFGPGDPDRWPGDTTLDISRARALLQTSLPGVDAVLAAAEGG